MLRFAVALALGGLALLAPAAVSKPQLCRASVIQQAVVDAGRLTQQDVASGEVVDLVRAWTGSRFKVGKAKKLKTAPRRFYRPSAAHAGGPRDHRGFSD